MENILIVNFKTYEETSGDNALKVALLCEKAAKETGKKVIVCVQAVDLRLVSSKVSIPVYAQHVDDSEFGANTGSIVPEAVILAGAKGTLINHSEKRIPEKEIARIVTKCRNLGVKSIVCAKDAKEARILSFYRPDFIAIEPPELIGGEISVSSAEPEVIKKTVVNSSGVPVLCGAGVHTRKDVSKAIRLGTKGVLLASGVAKALDPYKKILELLEGL